MGIGKGQEPLYKIIERGDGGAPDKCWEWQHSKLARGYGIVRYKGKVIKTHRLSYMLHVGELDNSLVINHICFNRSCWNPRHLEQITQAKNCQYLECATSVSKTNIRGVSWHKASQKWRAVFNINGKPKHIGLFSTLEEAEAAVTQARIDAGYHRAA